MIEYDLTEGEIEMKSIKINEKLRTRIISGGLSLVLVASGFCLGKLDSKNNNSSKPSNTTIVSEDEFVNQYLSDYIEKRDALEKKIASLLEQKERLQNVETFNMEDLVVMENSNVDNETNLYILRATGNGGICYEYHNAFQAWYRLHYESEKHYDWCLDYIHFDECQPLFNYLTDEEIETLTNNGGKITTLELDEILVRIRSEYQEQISENNHSRSITKN